MSEHISALKIQRLWKSYTNTYQLRAIYNYLRTNLSPERLQELSNKCDAISVKCKGDGAGLLSGALVDMFLSEYFHANLDAYKECHEGESDMKIHDIPLSLKTLKSGKSTVALDWSKNKTPSKREHFSTHIMVLNLSSCQWWKNSPTSKMESYSNKIAYNEVVKAGIYLIDKQFCKRYVTLASNNKTNTLVTEINLYRMLQRSKSQNLFIEIPEPEKCIQFRMVDAFSSSSSSSSA